MLNFLKKLFGLNKKNIEKNNLNKNIKEIRTTKSLEDVFFDLWDYINFKSGSQSEHISRVIGFEEWVDMEEIRRRIKELYGISYKNERSLYPYIKTLVDCNLIEINDAGGKRKWRKKSLMVKLKKKKDKKEKEDLKEEKNEKNTEITV